MRIYVPQSLCFPISMFPGPMFPSLYVPPGPMFPNTYVPRSPCSRSYMYVPRYLDYMVLTRLCSPVSMFPITYVSQYLYNSMVLCSPVTIPQYLCSPIPMFPCPMFPNAIISLSYVPRSLCLPVPMFPGPMFPDT